MSGVSAFHSPKALDPGKSSGQALMILPNLQARKAYIEVMVGEEIVVPMSDLWPESQLANIARRRHSDTLIQD